MLTVVLDALMLTIWVLWTAQATAALVNVIVYLSRIGRWVSFHDSRVNSYGIWTPPAAIIIPIKGADEHLAEHLEAVQHQQYPEYRIIFVVESEEDPAFAALSALPKPQDADTPVTFGCRRIDVVVAGRGDRGGQKVQNQLAALRVVAHREEAVVFADADAVPHSYWLYYMVDILRRGEPVAAGTGYRWFIPIAGQSTTLATCCAAAINAGCCPP